MRRRDFLRHSSVGVLALGWRRVLAMGHMHDMPAAVPLPPLADLTALPSGEPLRALPTLVNGSAVDGLFMAALAASPAQRDWVAAHPTTVWTYNGQIPGPLIELWEGDTAEIHFRNQLGVPTTVHWHGLSVPPSSDGGPHFPVRPGGQQRYRLPIAHDAAGSYWYHPHPHGHTAEQVFHGLAGPLIVRSRRDPLVHLPEQHLFISDLVLSPHRSRSSIQSTRTPFPTLGQTRSVDLAPGALPPLAILRTVSSARLAGSLHSQGR